MFPERWLELAAGLALIAATRAWVVRGSGRRGLELLAIGWGLLWVVGWAGSYWLLQRAASALRDGGAPEEGLARLSDNLALSIHVLTAARIVFVLGFLALVVIHLKRGATPDGGSGAGGGEPGRAVGNGLGRGPATGGDDHG